MPCHTDPHQKLPDDHGEIQRLSVLNLLQTTCPIIKEKRWGYGWEPGFNLQLYNLSVAITGWLYKVIWAHPNYHTSKNDILKPSGLYYLVDNKFLMFYFLCCNYIQYPPQIHTWAFLKTVFYIFWLSKRIWIKDFYSYSPFFWYYNWE